MKKSKFTESQILGIQAQHEPSSKFVVVLQMPGFDLFFSRLKI